MTSKSLKRLSGAALALLAFTGSAYAEGECSVAKLKGTFAFSAHGNLLGILEPVTGTLHPLATPAIIDGVAIQTFDGAGSISRRTDFLNTNGAPRGGQTDFNPNQSGTYTVKSDCTGTMHIKYDSGAVLDAEIVIADDSSTIKGILSKETVPSFNTTPDGTTCTFGCALGVQVSLDGKRTEGSSERQRDR
ncbi:MULTISPECIES: hypothetical protein [Paraburkholderia]|uniref:Uncharacterized protein n=1 Tax=Paraburkholderia madseniana TaxID=2599607 RepID=A0AAP5F293_9BURK|nr:MULTISPECIES: hypothetical protein [Paraburkholderia]MCX4152315.1 hypothetical protein [Paraburkholderia madseniana]MDN7155244.1 hypothetical protein [Paraburkholderia sp. WS6]MDQ6414127.1 hypothetical protein [Paraburkholderia madseniana]